MWPFPQKVSKSWFVLSWNLLNSELFCKALKVLNFFKICLKCSNLTLYNKFVSSKFWPFWNYKKFAVKHIDCLVRLLISEENHDLSPKRTKNFQLGLTLRAWTENTEKSTKKAFKSTWFFILKKKTWMKQIFV